ncbi:hypothetical protein DPEC_G00042040 [Dallia pectoralis]|uniref:Uncharacterized protein n=1 Tax=Dallia pectoralis TaxID=75939 RepID=A0ACC2H8P5_DALPE|nr:hypothetical protein DPEC_G00042040 [Dallia pectoralis]
MWYPIPTVVPLPLWPHQNLEYSQMSNASGTSQMNMVHYQYGQHLFPNAMNQLAAPLRLEEGRKFLLNRSVFDLVKETQFLELTDPKLLSWYLSLPVKDRELIQEEGGLHQFLLRHPALEVIKPLVYVKELVDVYLETPDTGQTMSSANLNKSRRPSFYGVNQCPNCGTSCSSGVERCQRCGTPIQKMIPGCHTEEGSELRLLPNDVQHKLNLFSCSQHQGVQSVQVRHHIAAGADQQFRDCQLQPSAYTTTTTSPSNVLGGLVNLQESFHSACAVSSDQHVGSDHVGSDHVGSEHVGSEHVGSDHVGSAEDPLGPLEAHSSEVQLLSRLWEEGGLQDDYNSSGVAECSDADTQARPTQARLSLDMELQIRSGVKRGQSAACEPGESMALSTHNQMKDSLMLNQETPPEYYSFNSTQDYSEWNDTTNTNLLQLAELECNDSLSLVATRGNTEQPSRADETRPHEGSTLSLCAGVSIECEQVNQNIMEDHNLMKKASQKESTVSTVPPSQTTSDHPGWSGESLTAPQSPQDNEQPLLYEESFMSSSPGVDGGVMASAVNLNQTFDVTPIVTNAEQITANQSMDSSPLPGQHKVSVGTDSQVRGTASSDKSVLTEVHMADLDYLTKEFIKLQSSQEELNMLKVKMSSLAGVRRGGGCSGCASCQRGTRAELSLLAHQYGMCQQHCWRRYYTSPEGDLLVQGPETPPESLMEVLQVLEEDYREMRRLVLSGVPLDQLKPLSVDSKRVSSENNYIPALIISKSLGIAMTSATDGSSLQLQVEDAQIKTRCEGVITEEDPMEKGPVVRPNAQDPVVYSNMEDCSSGKAVPLLSCPYGKAVPLLSCPYGKAVPLLSCPYGKAVPLSQKPVDSLSSRPGDQNHESWYDAEENLGPNGEAMKVRSLEEAEEEEGDGLIGLKEKDQSSMLLVTDLPANVTEEEIMLWFEKYQPTEVSISRFSNNMRVAIVTVSCLNGADGAVGEMDRYCIQGHTVHVQHILRTGTQTPGLVKQDQLNQPAPSTSTAESFRVFIGSQDPKKDYIHSTIQLMPQPPSLQKRTTICDSPTASGTCVPQHYATMGSFDTLMERLMERHPDVGRQRIVDALLELRAEHQGSLCGLPLRDIVDMTSDLLNQ